MCVCVFRCNSCVYLWKMYITHSNDQHSIYSVSVLYAFVTGYYVLIWVHDLRHSFDSSPLRWWEVQFSILSLVIGRDHAVLFGEYPTSFVKRTYLIDELLNNIITITQFDKLWYCWYQLFYGFMNGMVARATMVWYIW